MDTALLLAFSAGMLAAFNPCGFALLPAYLGLFLADRSGGRAVGRALAVGGAVTAGFVVTFGLVGAAVSLVSLRFGDWLSVVTITMGLALTVAGIVMLGGRDVSVRLPRATLAVSGSPLGMVSYGVVYATVSLSCTLPVFMAAVVASFDAEAAGPGGTAGMVGGIAAFLAYALGMGTVLTVLAVAMALFRESAGARARRLTPFLARVSGAFLIAAGGYVIWYGWVEFQSFRGVLVTAGPTAWVAEASAGVSAWLMEVPLGAAPVALAALVAVAVVTRRWRRRGPEVPHPTPGATDRPPATPMTDLLEQTTTGGTP